MARANESKNLIVEKKPYGISENQNLSTIPVSGVDIYEIGITFSKFKKIIRVLNIPAKILEFSVSFKKNSIV